MKHTYLRLSRNQLVNIGQHQDVASNRHCFREKRIKEQRELTSTKTLAMGIKRLGLKIICFQRK